MLVLTRADVERLLAPRAMLDALERGFRDHSSGRTSVPPRSAARSPSGLLGAMPAWVANGGLAIKAVTVFPSNVAAGRPSHQGVIVLFDEHHGAPLCVMDAEHITAMRTGGAAAVSVKLLAHENARALAILGAGVQGMSHLLTVPLVRDVEVIRVASRNRTHAEQLAARDARCEVVDSFEAAVTHADIVCCCTDTRRPILAKEWLSPGTHVTSVGGTFGPELPAELIAQHRVFVEWRGAGIHEPPAGAHELQGCDPGSLTELGELLDGTRPGRRDDAEITVYKSTGVGFEDAVTAKLVYEQALADGVGVTADW